MLLKKMNHVSVLAIAVCSVAVFTSCKSSESAYKKAYEKAQAQSTQNQQTVAEDNTQAVKIAPVQTTTTTVATTQTDDVANATVRKENVELISGAGLQAYSVVCGSFSLKTNAEGLQQTLKDKGFSAQIVYNSSIKFYRVIASTSADKAAAVQSRNSLRSSYPDAWLLYKGN